MNVASVSLYLSIAFFPISNFQQSKIHISWGKRTQRKTQTQLIQALLHSLDRLSLCQRQQLPAAASEAGARSSQARIVPKKRKAPNASTRCAVFYLERERENIFNAGVCPTGPERDG